MAQIIDGKAVAQKVKDEVRAGAEAFRAAHGRAPGLHVVLVGDDQASAVYVGHKEKAAAEVGIAGKVYRLPAATTEAKLLELVEELNQNDAVDGILVQFPVPSHISQTRVIETISPAKDVDGLHPLSAGALWAGADGLVSCTPSGCMRLLREAGVKLSGANAVVVGRSNLVGKPVAALLLAENATVTIAHSKTRDLGAVCRQADVLIAAVGREAIIKGDYVKPGAAVIDVGMNRNAAGKLCGDVDFEAAEKVAGFITKVPGGVGPMTVACLLENTLKAAKMRQARGR
ncbi:MAG TPA: bifunctional methylenetetrahydrofolate dehydrogenase/methenyltetrahydrofolate cyclohydrolase FolD [Polyangiaceae bacterium]|nr:bifunctional methylenetetrahydrofolate dehydrogenase/methenyltetrahydrofolate cyclohydrolase FolD [Polyangiaceae bacterium]